MVTKLTDYIPQIKEKFPSLSEGEIRKIVSFGFRIFHYVIMRGASVSIMSTSDTLDGEPTKINAITGYLTWDSLKHYINGLHKWRIKERILYSFRNTEWDGYYYFAMAETKHKQMVEQLENTRLKFIQLDSIYCVKVLKEIPHDHSLDFIYRLKYPFDVGYKIYFKKFREKKTDIEFVGINTESTWYRNQQIPLTED